MPEPGARVGAAQEIEQHGADHPLQRWVALDLDVGLPAAGQARALSAASLSIPAGPSGFCESRVARPADPARRLTRSMLPIWEKV